MHVENNKSSRKRKEEGIEEERLGLLIQILTYF